MTDPSTDEITLRSPAPDEMREAFAPLMPAFASDFTEAEFAAERPLIDPERFVNAFVGGERVATGGAFGMRMTVPGGEIGASGITAIGVRPDHTRRGLLRRMMDWLWDDARARDEPVAVLIASEAAIYQRFGYGVGALNSRFEVDRSRLVFRQPMPPRDGVRIRMIDIDEAATVFPPIYDALRAITPGTLTREGARWRNIILSDEEWMRRGDGPTYRAVIEVDGVPRGYALYRVKSEWTDRGPAGRLLVQELAAVDPESEQRLWQFVSSIDLVGSVTAWRGPVPHPLQFWLQEPRRLGLTTIDGLWLRILDLPTTLAARTYAGEGTVVLEVTDDLIVANAGRWHLTARGDQPASVERTTAEPDLAIDIGALASIYLGAFRVADLVRAGQVTELRPGALRIADVLFTSPRAPFSNTMF